MAYQEESSASGNDEPWIQWFCGLKGHAFLCEVERSYIEDGFNLYGLRACVSNFSDCLDLILDMIGTDDSDDSHLTHSAFTLYGLIHARYVITAHGLDAMYNKYTAKIFGICPLVQCNGQPVLPVGTTDDVGADTVKTFCPKCQCVYHPMSLISKNIHHDTVHNSGSGAVDGAAFGTTFPHLFLMTFGNLVPDRLSPASAYIPRIFGFRVNQSAQQRIGRNGPKSSACYSSTSGNSKRIGLTATASRSQLVFGLGENRKGPDRLSPHSTKVCAEAAAGNDDTGSYPQGKYTEVDKATSRPAASTNDSSLPQVTFDENVSQTQPKTKRFGSSLKVTKKRGNDSERKHKKNVLGDCRNMSKQKFTNSMGKYGNLDDNEHGSVANPKKQKRSSN